jgi:hypothetical protein
MSAAYDTYLTQKYGFHGIVSCGNYKTLAEAQQWLQGRVSRSQSPGMQYQYVATDWTYGAGPIDSAPAAPATAQAATEPAAQPAASSAASGPTAFYVCAGLSQGVSYDSAVFEAANDAGTARKMYFAYKAYLSEKHHINAMARCTPRPTRAEAQAYVQKYSAGVSGGVSQHVATGWVYDPTPRQPAQPTTNASPVPSPAPASIPVASPPVAPKPVVPQPVTAAAPIKPVAPVPAPAKKTEFVVCMADADPQTRYFNPPVDGGDGSYETWQPSYKSFMESTYHYQRRARCNKLPTLAEAQTYHQMMLDQARLNTSIKIVITDWKYP